MTKTKLIFSTLILLVGFAFFIEAGITLLGGEKYKVVQSQPSTLGFEDYLAQGTCEPPQSGCGDGWYWDYNSCSCMSSTPTGCTEPASGCGDGWYWDSGACACNYYNEPLPSPATCDEPPEGCGTNHYWNSTSCSCVYDGSCVEPVPGCGNNYYWDHDDCVCRPYATCTEPTGGCGGNYYWDTSSCSCMPVTPTGCEEPQSGCGYDYYWDSSQCYCAYSGYTCSAPTSGCGEDYYWDYDQCYCRSYDGSSEPIGGYDDSTTIVDEYSSENFDRLAYEPQTRIDCVKSTLTGEEYQKLRYFMPTTNSEYDEIHNLGKKVESCWGDGNSTGQYDNSKDSEHSMAYIENEKCLLNALGENAYREIYKGQREPTYEEHLWFEKCYGNIKQDVIVYITASEDLPDTVEICLKNTLGGLYDRVKDGQIDVPSEQRSNVNRCFGVDPQPFEESPSYELPDDVKNCLISAVGDVRFREISSGLSEPTATEKRKGEVCFNKINSTQQNFLPPPPEQVPYFEPDPETVNFAEVFQESEEIKGKKIGGRMKFSGKGPPDSTITIYVFSEPIVVTTKTDENGDWIYEFDQPLEGGKHVAYATVRTTSGKVVRSTVFDFEVAAASTEDIDRFLDESKTVDTQTKFIRYVFIVVGLAFIVVLSMQSYNYFKRMAPQSVSGEDKKSTGTDGDGKGDISSGSVN